MITAFVERMNRRYDYVLIQRHVLIKRLRKGQDSTSDVVMSADESEYD